MGSTVAAPCADREKVATIDLGGTRSLVIVADANSHARLQHIASVASACAATLKLTPKK